MNQRLMGQWIVYTKRIMKHVEYTNINKTTTHPSHKIHKRKKAMIIGERWLPDGITTFSHSGWGNEDDADFRRTGTTRCLLVVEGLRKKPIWVDINGTTLLDGTPMSEVMK